MAEDPRIDDGSLFPVYNAEPFKPESIFPTLESTLDRVWRGLTEGKRKLPEQLEVGPAEENDWIEIDTDQITSKDLNPGISGVLDWIIEMLWQTGERFKDMKRKETGDPTLPGIRTKRFISGCIIHAGLGPLESLVMTTRSNKEILPKEPLRKKRLEALDSGDKPFLSKFRKKPVHLMDGFTETSVGSFRIGYISVFDKNRIGEIEAMYKWNISSIINIAAVWGISCSTELFTWDIVKEARKAILDFVNRYEKEYD